MNIELFHVYSDATLDDYRIMATKIKSGVFLLDKAYARGTNLVFDTNASSETDAVVFVFANGTTGAANYTELKQLLTPWLGLFINSSDTYV